MEGVWLAFRVLGRWGMDPSKDTKMDRRDILSLSATTAVGLIIPLEYIFAQVPASESEMKTLSVYMSAAEIARCRPKPRSKQSTICLTLCRR